MRSSSYAEAMATAGANKHRRWPSAADSRSVGGLLFPAVSPRFTLNTPCTVFTIGSCFARNIEEVLAPMAVTLPTLGFTAPKHEWPHRLNGLLNVYNPGSIAQRITDAVRGIEAPAGTLYPSPTGFLDLLLPASAKVTLSRAMERRAEIDLVYSELPGADLLIITLGMVEAWFDTVTGVYLNSIVTSKAPPGRFIMRVMDLEETYQLMAAALTLLFEARPSLRVLLTVSPVPLESTFTTQDVVTANALSKCTLRLCAQRLWDTFPQVDYFPSYEIITSGGLSAFEPDQVHVKHECVREVTTYMADRYFS